MHQIYGKSLVVFDSMSKIDSFLKNHFSGHPLKNPEICYLLTNFYNITMKKTPKELRKYV